MDGQSPPILLDIPTEFESERLIIRAPRPGDGAAVNAGIRESINELRPWMPWAQAIPPVEDTETHIRQSVARWITREDLPLLLFRKDNGQFAGGSGLHRIEWSVPAMEIGYWLRTSLVGQGYMTEAVEAITRYALATLGARRVEIRCEATNKRSAAVAERADYTLEARLHHHRRNVHGELSDTLIYVIFPAE